MRLAAVLAVAVVLGQAVAAVLLLLAGAWVPGVLLAVGGVAVAVCAVRISRSVRDTSLPATSFTASEQRFW